MSMTKEEILYETHKDIQGQGLEELRVKRSMDIFAKEQAIAFAEWIKETNWAEKDTWGKYSPPSIPTIEQLYNLFLKPQQP